ncbi:hypothetical protein Poly51_28240 [Rubripirellula tenax]|uniref:Uncharacterized protein n=1 Tax=Rubripirellula tenax TaxID=2528015 RepID=A0A5C6F9R9_9BACT|nr:hypothetical protein Poly51_28240 [Rubripirellula tenax]
MECLLATKSHRRHKEFRPLVLTFVASKLRFCGFSLPDFYMTYFLMKNLLLPKLIRRPWRKLVALR